MFCIWHLTLKILHVFLRCHFTKCKFLADVACNYAKDCDITWTSCCEPSCSIKSSLKALHHPPSEMRRMTTVLRAGLLQCFLEEFIWSLSCYLLTSVKHTAMSIVSCCFFTVGIDSTRFHHLKALIYYILL